ncbi:single-stranded DNA-binding protein [Streptomyces megasporus]|uniref:single-stranded DNA-binding protein n=1 Tax=Streptomyces megasporus TaxID=44060 RepID=UPI00068F30FA|nr:single-stranded DNA-binding protein [Streptomyces megasporus]
MAGETTATFRGTVHGDLELRFTPGKGVPVVRFRLATIRREYDREAGRWYDAAPLFVICTLWRRLAENAAEALQDGVDVVVTGKLAIRGEKLFLDADDLEGGDAAVSLRQRIAYAESAVPPALATQTTPPATVTAPAPATPAKAPAVRASDPAKPDHAPTAPPEWEDPERLADWAAITAPRPRRRPWAVPC